MRKIIYLIEQPLDKRNFDRFGIQLWLDGGWDAEAWDLTPWAHPRVWRQFVESGRAAKDFAGYVPITSYRDVQARLANARSATYYVDLTGAGYSSTRVKKRFAEMGLLRVILKVAHPLSEEGVSRTLVSRIRKAFDGGVIKALIARLTQLALRWFVAAPPSADVVVVSGHRGIRTAIAQGDAGKILAGHNLDFDLYRQLAPLATKPARPYAVFLDQDICFHPDHVAEDVPFYATPEKYFPVLCRGLLRMSAVRGVDVRIAAHPRSAYQHKSEAYFGGLPVEYGKTPELVRDCEFVVTHWSTAIQFAVLFKKPIVIVTTDEIASSAGAKFATEMAEVFGKSAINLDRDLSTVDWARELTVDVQRYDAYRNEYIKIDGTPNLPLWIIVRNHLETRGLVQSATAET